MNPVILSVEDSDEDFDAFIRILGRSQLPVTVYRAGDGDEALDYLYRQGCYRDPETSPRPTLILMDLNLPGTDGRDVISQVKQDKQLQTIPIVVFSTSNNPKDVEICYHYGVNSYMIKPMGTKALTATIESLIHYWFDFVLLPVLD